MLRALIIGGFMLVALFILSTPFVLDVDEATEALLVNVGSEIIGIVITVAVVEWFFERRRLHNRGRQLAWDALHAIGHAVWVWQGGPREMETDEVLGVLNAVSPNDPLPDFTEGLFLSIGTRSRRLLSNEPESVTAVPGFMNGLEHLARLSSMRDSGAKMPSRRLADILEEGTIDVARSLRQPTERHLASLIRYRDPGAESQKRRLFGDGRGGGPLPRVVEPDVLE